MHVEDLLNVLHDVSKHIMLSELLDIDKQKCKGLIAKHGAEVLMHHWHHEVLYIRHDCICSVRKVSVMVEDHHVHCKLAHAVIPGVRSYAASTNHVNICSV